MSDDYESIIELMMPTHITKNDWFVYDPSKWQRDYSMFIYEVDYDENDYEYQQWLYEGGYSSYYWFYNIGIF